jgi:transposase
MANTLISGSEPSNAPQEPLGGEPRLQRAERHQLGWQAVDIDGLIPLDHRARAVWEYVESLDLSAFEEGIRAVEGRAGRPAIDPAILVALWLYATLEGVGSARALERLCGEHHAYRWILGGVTVNHHTLSDFRVRRGKALDRLLTQSAGVLLAEGLVKLRRVAQDGMRVRASASAPSFRRGSTLQDCMRAARAQVDRLRRELEADPGATSRRQEAARRRAVQERLARVQRAVRAAQEIEEQRKEAEKKKGPSKEEARASTTDPDARVMRMADGGFRPAYNAQFATDTASQVIVGVEVTTRGTDTGELTPMLEQVRRRYRRAPRQWLADGGYLDRRDIESLASRGTDAFVPPMKKRKRPGRPWYPPSRADGPGVAAWRRRMKTSRGLAIYRERPGAAECVNAQARNRGLTRLLVRGREKVRAALLWFAIAHNLLRATRLRAATT